jgi:hypothetical protein
MQEPSTEFATDADAPAQPGPGQTTALRPSRSSASAI